MGSGYKSSWAGTVASGDLKGFLMAQTVMTFDDKADRDAQLAGNLEDGMVCYLRNIGAYFWYDSNMVAPVSSDGWRPLMSNWGVQANIVWQNLTPNNAVVESVYRWEMGDIHMRGSIVLGSTTVISGIVGFKGLLNRTADQYDSHGSGRIIDTGTKVEPCVPYFPDSGDYMQFASASGLVDANTPHVWANGDALHWDITYTPTTAD